ncbi:MAG: sigma-70 family RNA polymerase sigma factor [Clostridiales bacterium]|nr:sigma-70 family RNA polymerase sigma factor [Clostridiales bacterium]
MSKKVIICGVDTSALPKLSQKESNELLIRIEQGDANARNYFINCNLRLVLSIVQRYSYRVDNPDDLFQIGCVGLIKAVDNFRVSVGVCFSTYAVPMIVGEIRRFLREGSMRVSRGIRDVAYQALQTREKLEAESVDEASIQQIADEMQLPVYKVLYCLDAISEPVSLSEAVYSDEDDSLTLQDHISDGKCSEYIWAENVTLFDALNTLEDKEKNILLKRYFEGKTQMEVSREIGLSQAQVSRLEKNAMVHLRNEMS